MPEIAQIPAQTPGKAVLESPSQTILLGTSALATKMRVLSHLRMTRGLTSALAVDKLLVHQTGMFHGGWQVPPSFFKLRLGIGWSQFLQEQISL